MITPEYLQDIVGKMELQMAEVNYKIVAKIVERLKISIEEYGEAKLITSSLKNILQLEAQGLLYSDIEQIVEKSLPGIEKEVRRAFLDGIERIEMFEGFEYKGREVKTVYEAVEIDTSLSENKEPTLEDVKPNVEHMSDDMKKHAESAFRRTKGEMKNLTRTTADVAQRDFSQLLDKAMLKVEEGSSVGNAIMEALEEAKGLGAKVRYPSGKEDYLEVALARAVRTGINQANTDMILAKCGELGVNYVKTSSHMGARVTKVNDYTNHSWWQGKVYRLNWNDESLSKYKREDVDYSVKEKVDNSRKKNRRRGTNQKYVGTFQDFSVCGYGHIQGLCGINCRHTLVMFFPNVQSPVPDKINQEENEKRYELEQKQRAMERTIRQTKRKIAEYKAAEEYESVKQKLQYTKDLLAKQMRKYQEFCRENNLPQREWSTKIP